MQFLNAGLAMPFDGDYDASAPVRAGFLPITPLLLGTVLALFTVPLSGCNDSSSVSRPTAPLDTIRVVDDRYTGGAPRRVEFWEGRDSSLSRMVRTRTYSPSGILLKEYRSKERDVLYFHELAAMFDSTDGLREFMQGMWIGKEPKRQLKRFERSNGENVVAQVKSNTARTFRRDTLIISQYMTIYDRKAQAKVGHDLVEVGFRVDYEAPNLIKLTDVLYRRRPDTSQVLANTPMLPYEAKGRITDTLRVYGPNRYRILTAKETSERVFKRHARGPNVPGRLPRAFR